MQERGGLKGRGEGGISWIDTLDGSGVFYCEILYPRLYSGVEAVITVVT